MALEYVETDWSHRDRLSSWLKNKKSASIDDLVMSSDDAALVKILAAARKAGPTIDAPPDPTIFPLISAARIPLVTESLLLQEQFIKFQKHEDSQAALYFNELFEKLRERNDVMSNIESFCSTNSQSTILKSGKRLQSCHLKMLWKDCEVLLFLLSSLMKDFQSPMDLTCIESKVEIYEFHDLMHSINVMAAVKFYLSTITQVVLGGERRSFLQVEVPPPCQSSNPSDADKQEVAFTQSMFDKFDIFRNLHMSYEQVVDKFYSDDFATIIAEGQSTMTRLENFKYGLLNDAVWPSWVASGEALMATVDKMINDVNCIIKVGDQSVFRQRVIAAMLADEVAVFRDQNFRSKRQSGSDFRVMDVEGLRGCLRDYIFPDPLQVPDSFDYTDEDPETNPWATTDAMSTKDLLVRANFIFRLRQASAKDFWTHELEMDSSNYTDDDEMFTVQEVITAWFANVSDPDSQVGSSEIKLAYDDLMNKILMEKFIFHSDPSSADKFNPGIVLQNVCGERCFVRPPNVINSVARLDVFFDLRIIDERRIVWAVKYLPAVVMQLQGPSGGSSRESASATLHEALTKKFDVVDQVTTNSKSLFVIPKITNFAQDVKGKRPQQMMEAHLLLTQQLSALTSESSIGRVEVLLAVQNWSDWKKEDWEIIDYCMSMKLLTARARARVATLRRQQLISDFESFHEQMSLAVEYLPEILVSSFVASGVNSHGDYRDVFLGLSSHEYFYRMVSAAAAIPTDASEGRATAATILSAGSPAAVDLIAKRKISAQIFQLHQILGMRPQTRAAHIELHVAKRVQESIQVGNWAATKQHLKLLAQNYISFGLWYLIESAIVQVDFDLNYDRILLELERNINITSCKSRFELAMTMSEAFLSLSMLSMHMKTIISEMKKLAEARLGTGATSIDAFPGREYSADFIFAVDWMMSMRLAILTQDWGAMESLEAKLSTDDSSADATSRVCPDGVVVSGRWCTYYLSHSCFLCRLFGSLVRV